jgi:enamine deaminase RidA (YjgF/YER057c/UK114 family)
MGLPRMAILRRVIFKEIGAAVRPREIIWVEPLSAYLENWKAPTSAVTRSGDTIYVPGFPPFDPQTGKVLEGASMERPTETVLEQLKLCVEAAGSVPGERSQMQRVLHVR